MDSTSRSRRGFIAAAGVTVSVIGAAAAMRRMSAISGNAGGSGTITLIASDGVVPQVPGGAREAWTAAIGSAVRIFGENGVVEGRIVSVAEGAMGGVRPASLRPEALIVYFEVDPATAPVGDKIYSVISSVSNVRELFLLRGEDVLGKAVMLAVLN